MYRVCKITPPSVQFFPIVCAIFVKFSLKWAFLEQNPKNNIGGLNGRKRQINTLTKLGGGGRFKAI